MRVDVDIALMVSGVKKRGIKFDTLKVSLTITKHYEKNISYFRLRFEHKLLEYSSVFRSRQKH